MAKSVATIVAAKAATIVAIVATTMTPLLLGHPYLSLQFQLNRVKFFLKILL